MADIRFIGDPDRLRVRFSKRLSVRVLKDADARAKLIAERWVAKVREHIDKQDLPWDPLTPDYKIFKKRAGLNENIWIASGLLRDQVEVRPGREVTLQDGTTIRSGYTAGIYEDQEHPQDPLDPSKGTVPTSVIMNALEFGFPDRGLPPRPLMRVSFLEVLAEIRRQPPPPARGSSTEQSFENART